MKVIVTGGAGYIGSHTVVQIARAGHEVVIVDDLSLGHAAAIGDCELVRLDLADTAALRDVIEGADAVMHFAANAYVGESVENPRKYYFNNVVNTLGLLDAMRDAGIDRFVFSSSCTVYGMPDAVPVTEDMPVRPMSPYGRTKAIVEGILEDYGVAYGLKSARLRYFNAAGAMPDGSNGEDHDPETHLIPIAIQAALGQRESIKVFGTDYPTPDGTCVRDYVHVLDLGRAHVLAMEQLDARGSMVYNLGTGNGFSVREVIDTVKEVSGRDFKVEYADRRPGDAAGLYGSVDKVKADLGWEPEYPTVRDIVETAWAWHSTHPNGFGG